MKKLIYLFAVTHFGIGMIRAAEFHSSNFNHGFIFTEGHVTFSVYPDGEFDFYMNQGVNARATIGLGNVGISFNAGFDYGPYVQYDEFGAVIQIENIPIFYDYYGRVSGIGSIAIGYRNNRLYRIGGMHLFYSPLGAYSYHTGFINTYNRSYVFNPMHQYFMRPAVSFCLVSRNPYRRYYQPKRYRFVMPFRNNFRRAYATVGRPYQHVFREDRDRMYANNSRLNPQGRTVRSNREMVQPNHSSRPNPTMGNTPIHSRYRNSNVPNRDTRSTRNPISREITPNRDRQAKSFIGAQRNATDSNFSNNRRNINSGSIAENRSTAPRNPKANPVNRNNSTRYSSKKGENSRTGRRNESQRSRIQ